MVSPGLSVVPRSGLAERLLNLALGLSVAILFWAFLGGLAYLLSIHGSLPLRTDPLLGARQHLTRGNVAGAVSQLRVAILLNATDLRSLNEMGELLLRDRRYDESIAVFEQALDLKPDSRAMRGIGDVLFAQGRYRDAADHYERSLILQPNQATVLNDLGMARALQGDFDRAIVAFDASLALVPDSRVRANLERAKADRGRAAAFPGAGR